MVRAMKDSDIEWIGEIPQEWNTCKVKQCATDSNSLFNDGDWIESPYITDSGLRLIQTGNIGEGFYKDQGFRFISERTFQELNCKYVYPNDILISRLASPVGRACLAPNVADKMVCSVDVCILRPNSDIDSRFLANYFALSGYIEHANLIARGTTLQRISRTQLGNISVILPPLHEQQSIAAFLDFKCRIIDSTIEKQNMVIEKLKLYKQSVITEAVTKGLDPTVNMKPSGIEWIGMMPEHWNTRALKFILKERNQKNVPIITNERLSLSIDKGVTLYADKTTNKDRFKDDVTQYKVAYSNDLVINSMNVIVGAAGISNYLGCVSPAYYVMYSDKPEVFSIKFYDYAFKTTTIRKVLFCLGKGIMAIDRGNDRVNTCRLKVSSYDLGRLKFPVPPITEQQKIVEYLGTKIAAIDSTITTKQIVIDKLTEYKKSLIYECVTGKREEV